MEQARQAVEQGDLETAVELASQAIQLEPQNVNARLMRASVYDALRQHTAAIGDYDVVVAKVPESARVLHLRGRARFKAGDIAGSIEDFDRASKLESNLELRLWERGISYYYAKEFAKGAEQFEKYQAYDASDVENVVWRYLCQAQEIGFEKAREQILPLDREDRRIPLMTVYALYRGKATTEDVLEAARAGDPNEDDLRHRLFYAHLYIGLYFESKSEMEAAQRHLGLAEEHQISHYMWDVAHVHLIERGWVDKEEPEPGR